MHTYSADNRHGNQHINITVEKPPHCPICHRAIDAVFVTAYMQFSVPQGLGREHYGYIVSDLVFRCPHRSCDRLFIAVYNPVLPSHGREWRLERMFPETFVGVTVDKHITNMSPQFPVLYNQSAAAEHHGLNLICGPGYRKALEFLVKDFAINDHPEAAEEIKEKLLGQVLAEYIQAPRIREIAKRAAWLGNDQTHYVQKWEGKDVEDLKRLIGLTVHWISAELESRELIKSMPAGPK